MQEVSRDTADNSRIDSPMISQYLALRQKAGDAMLFFRMGDFYELFFDDATNASSILGITLTARGQHKGKEIPMCGVPVHAIDAYLGRLVRHGVHVAIAEQVETPLAAKQRGGKSIVQRDIVRIVTPGTLMESSMLDARAPNRLAAIHVEGATAGVAAIDISTGEVLLNIGPADRLLEILDVYQPSEVLCAEASAEAISLAAHYRVTTRPVRAFDVARSEMIISKSFGVLSADGFGELTASERAALAGALDYLELTQAGTMPPLSPPQRAGLSDRLWIDTATRRSLELVQSIDGTRDGTVLSYIDRAQTAMGARLLQNWLVSPLANADAIRLRLDAVSWMHDRVSAGTRFTEHLRAIPDMERVAHRLCMDRGGPRELAALRQALSAADALRQQMRGEMPELLLSCCAELDTGLARCSGVLDAITSAIVDAPPADQSDGGAICDGYNAELDHFRTLRADRRRIILDLETRLREETQIRTLRIRHAKLFGYVVEVGPSQAPTLLGAPFNDQFRLRQTLANTVRFSTDELVRLDADIARALDAALGIEARLIADLIEDVKRARTDILSVATAVAQIDALAGLGCLAVDQDLVRPEVDDSLSFRIEGGRHPLVEAAKPISQRFVPNDCDLSPGGVPSITLLTGPNMAGKSTFLRQNALLIILAQMGSFVPAARAHIGVVDRLFSRVGASDDLARGRSTFMVEMIETAAILHQATTRSFVVLDEVGRGTATYDGMAIAWAVLEHLHDRTTCRGLFATHYHELTQLAARSPRIRNASMAVREWRGGIVFLHEVKAGPADRSYGLAVARLAGVPASVLRRAEAVLRRLEAAKPAADAAMQLSLFGEASEPDAPIMPSPMMDPVREALIALDPDQLSPREAMAQLYALKALATEEPTPNG